MNEFKCEECGIELTDDNCSYEDGICDDCFEDNDDANGEDV